jgi:ribonuclease P protein component
VLPAAQRLRRSSEFGAAVRAGRRAGRGPLVVHLASAEVTRPEIAKAGTGRPGVGRPEATDDLTTEPVRTGAGTEIPPARAGFVVSRAVGNAVTRNRVRRRLRHLVRERLDQMPAGSTVVVRALPGAGDLSYARLGSHLDAALAAVRAPRPRRGRPA